MCNIWPQINFSQFSPQARSMKLFIDPSWRRSSDIRGSTFHRLQKYPLWRSIFRVIFMLSGAGKKRKVFLAFHRTFSFIFPIHSIGLWRVSCSNLEVNAFRLYFGRGINQKTFEMEKYFPRTATDLKLIPLSRGVWVRLTCIGRKLNSETDSDINGSITFASIGRRQMRKREAKFSPRNQPWRHFIFIIF